MKNFIFWFLGTKPRSQKMFRIGIAGVLLLAATSALFTWDRTMLLPEVQSANICLVFFLYFFASLNLARINLARTGKRERLIKLVYIVVIFGYIPAYPLSHTLNLVLIYLIKGKLKEIQEWSETVKEEEYKKLLQDLKCAKTNFLQLKERLEKTQFTEELHAQLLQTIWETTVQTKLEKLLDFEHDLARFGLLRKIKEGQITNTCF